MKNINDALYERITFGIKDDDDFSWSSDRSITLELISDDDRVLVAYRYEDNWIFCNSVDEVCAKFVSNETVKNYLDSSNVDANMAQDMIIAIINLELGDMNGKYDHSFSLLENEDKVTEDYSDCFFVEENSVSTEVNVDDNSIDFLEVDGDSCDDIFEHFHDLINENTMIIVAE